MKNFRVTESSNKSNINKKFIIPTEISNYVDLPFTQERFRVFMFDGIRVKLIQDETSEYIVGSLF